jgi:hypothetical protein
MSWVPHATSEPFSVTVRTGGQRLVADENGNPLSTRLLYGGIKLTHPQRTAGEFEDGADRVKS